MTPPIHSGWGGARAGAGRPRPPCGTRNGADAHRRHGEPVCPGCAAAAAAYARARWAANPTPGRIRARARGRAYRRLAAEYPDRFASILALEKARARLRDRRDNEPGFQCQRCGRLFDSTAAWAAHRREIHGAG